MLMAMRHMVVSVLHMRLGPHLFGVFVVLVVFMFVPTCVTAVR